MHSSGNLILGNSFYQVDKSFYLPQESILLRNYGPRREDSVLIEEGWGGGGGGLAGGGWGRGRGAGGEGGGGVVKQTAAVTTNNTLRRIVLREPRGPVPFKTSKKIQHP